MSDQEEQIQDGGDQEDQDEEAEEEEEEEDEDDEDEDEDGEDQDEDEDEDEDDQEDQDEQKSEQQKPVPSFKPISQQFAFKNLQAQIASIGNSVDHFISSLPSRGGNGYRSYQPRIQLETYKPRNPEPLAQDKKYTIMKDEDVQVSMQPQIVIQQTLAPREQPKKQPYRISNQSTKFLAQLYQQNKKLKRWQNSQPGSQSGGWYKSKEKFERPEHERGLINVDDRNKQIDQAIELLRREDND